MNRTLIWNVPQNAGGTAICGKIYFPPSILEMSKTPSACIPFLNERLAFLCQKVMMLCNKKRRIMKMGIGVPVVASETIGKRDDEGHQEEYMRMETD